MELKYITKKYCSNTAFVLKDVLFIDNEMSMNCKKFNLLLNKPMHDNKWHSIEKISGKENDTMNS